MNSRCVKLSPPNLISLAANALVSLGKTEADKLPLKVKQEYQPFGYDAVDKEFIAQEYI